MELIIIKSGNDYIRAKNGTFHLVGLDKASVFPLEELELVRRHQADLQRAGFTDIILKKLVISEEDLVL